MELDKNETHVTLHVLDEKLRLIEEDNAAMESFIKENKANYNVAARRESTMQIIESYLKNLQLANI